MKLMNLFRMFVRDIREWIVQYFIFLVIPMIICSAFFLSTYQGIWEETKNSNIAALQFIASDLEQVFSESFLLEYNIQNSNRVNEAVKLSQPLNADKRYALADAANEIMGYIGSDNWLKNYYVYMPKSDMVLSVASYITGDELYRRLGENLGYTGEQWKELLSSKNDRILLDNHDTGTIAYVSSFPKFANNVSANVIIMFDENNFQIMLSSLDYLEGSSMMLLDDNNRILLGRNMNDMNADDFNIYAELTEEYNTIEINGKKVVAAGIALENIGIKVVSIVPYKVFWQTALSSLGWFALAALVCICIGIGVAVFFSLGQKNTWGKFRTILRAKYDKQPDALGFRKKEISAAIDNVVKEYNWMQQKLHSVEGIKKELLLSAALVGRIRPIDISAVFEKNEFFYEPDNFVVIIFRANRFSHMFDASDTETKTSETELGMFSHMVMMMIEMLRDADMSYEILNLDEKIVCIMEFGNLDKDMVYDKITKLEALREDMSRDMHEVFHTISISDIHDSILFLNVAYNEAVRVMEYQIAAEADLIMSYSKMVQETEMSYLYSLENEIELTHFIYEGKAEEAKQLFKAIYEKNIAVIKGSEVLAQCLIWNLTASILRTENELTEAMHIQKLPNILGIIDTKTSLDEARIIWETRIETICKEVLEAKKGKGNVVAEQVKEYILNHYTDSNLSNTEIADYFQMNVTYLSTFFKEKTGITPLAYIQKVRLDEAKRLLLSTNLTIEVISERVGINAASTLVRLFKKYEGVTPTAYAKKNRKNKK